MPGVGVVTPVALLWLALRQYAKLAALLYHTPKSRPVCTYCLRLDEAFFQHLLVAKPQIGDVG
jgi:hypothetical protein